MKNYLQNREKAIEWVNGKRDFNEGIAILKDARFKPGVVGVLERHGSGRNESDERLLYHMRDFIRCYASAEARQDTDLTIGVVDGKELQPDQQPNDEIPSMLSDETGTKLESGVFPEPIAKIIKRFRNAYVERDRLHTEMANLPETNDDETVEKRRRISDRTKELSDEMDKLYPQYAAYIKEGSVPEEETESSSEEDRESSSEEEPESSSEDGPENTPDDETKSSQSVQESKQQLQKERKSVATKILRARNMLLYQAETKQPKENPMTDVKKVAKYQAKIERLTQELNDIDMKLAALG